LAEPQKECHDSLKFHRKCKIDTRAVYSKSGKTVDFFSTRLFGLSTIATLHDANGKNAEPRSISNSYQVETISLNSLLVDHSAPEVIDYLSIDTEGSELEILSTFDFAKHEFKVWTIEHNFAVNREQILRLMQNNGYRRVFSDLSQVDDWFISREIALSIESKF